jgi:anti-anti-sigma factor
VAELSSYLTSRIEQGVLVLTITEPELHTELAESLLQEMTAAVDRAGARQVVLDCAKVKFLTSACLGALVTFRHFLRDKNGRMLLCSVDPLVADVLVTTRLADMSSSSKIPFGMTPDAAAAVNFLTRPASSP